MSYFDMTVKSVDAGGFIAIASSPKTDRQNELVEFNAFAPLPPRIPVHLGHDFAKLAGSGRPYYAGTDLMIDATFARNSVGQEARQLCLDGHLGFVSVAFTNAEKRADRSGITRVTKGDLVSCDLVSVPACREAAVLSVRGLRQHLTLDDARRAIVLADVGLALDDARRVLEPRRGPCATVVAELLRRLR